LQISDLRKDDPTKLARSSISRGMSKPYPAIFTKARVPSQTDQSWSFRIGPSKLAGFSPSYT
jgi:hypothetical protein